MRRTTAALALLAVTACGDPSPTAVDGTSTQESGAACRPSEPLPSLPPVPADLALPPGSVLTDARPLGGGTSVTGRVEAPVEQVLAHFRGAVDAAGFVLQRDEDEGRAGELAFFGARGSGQVTVGRLTCPRGATGFTVLSDAVPRQE